MLQVFCLLVALLANSAMAAEKIRYCDYPVYPPISWSDGKQVRGLAPGVVKKLFAELGDDVEIVELDNWNRCVRDAAEGRVDVVLMYRTAEREQSMVFSSVPVLREEVAVFVNRQHPVNIERLEDLANYHGGLLFGESYGVTFDRFVAEHQNVEMVSDSRQNFGKLIRGRIDFIVSERRTGQMRVETLPDAQDIVALPQAFGVDYLRVAVSRRSPLARRMPDIDAQLQRMVDSGEVDRLLDESKVAYRDMINLPANAQ
ncbi:substrate-binding periplasmic protein [Pseudomonas sp. NPDC086278]|uniref:substrate-binding periplasmic protein n=1 Tax=Pseudomonas sp. NPDC086278 TaxID=3390646 RepID=UPI003D091FA2